MEGPLHEPTAALPAPEMLEAALRAMSEGIALADATGHIVYSNPAADRILGVPPSRGAPEAWAKHYGAFRPGSDEFFSTEACPLVRALRGEETDGVEILIRNASIPGTRLISVTGRPIRDIRNQIIGAAAVFRDVTGIRAVEDDLRRTLAIMDELQKGKAELLGDLVHDMKGPLTAILAGTELVLSSDEISREDREGLSDVLTAVRTLHEMVLDMLVVQAGEVGKLEPECRAVDVRHLLEGACGGARLRGATISVEVRGAPFIHGDPELLRRVIGNLVDNCIRFADGKSRIWLEALPVTGGRVLLRVRDNGPGVPPELRERIFDRYTRLERTPDRNSRGSRGLGLRFCKVAVEAHGGRIWVEDNLPEGAAFCLELPEA